MPRNYYCAACGHPLEVTRKSLVNKGIIVDLVQTHECVEYTYIENIEDAKKPTGAKVTFDESETNEKVKFSNAEPGDRRKDKLSAAPTGILNKVKGDMDLGD